MRAFGGVLALLTGERMRRIAVLSVLWLSGRVLASAEHPPVKVPVSGWLSPATTESYRQPGAGNPGPELLRNALARHGLIDGRNVRVDMPRECVPQELRSWIP